MKRFELTLIVRKEDGNFLSLDKLESDNLVHLLAQFQIALAQVLEKQQQDFLVKHRIEDDDIPF